MEEVSRIITLVVNTYNRVTAGQDIVIEEEIDKYFFFETIQFYSRSFLWIYSISHQAHPLPLYIKLLQLSRYLIILWLCVSVNIRVSSLLFCYTEIPII